MTTTAEHTERPLLCYYNTGTELLLALPLFANVIITALITMWVKSSQTVDWHLSSCMRDVPFLVVKLS